MRPPRVRIGAAAADPADAAMLVEWLHAAGFQPVAIVDGEEPCSACLVRWPVAVDLQRMPAPWIVLHDTGADLSGLPSERVVETLCLPDQSEVRSLLQWSTRLLAALREITKAGAAATPPATCSIDLTARKRPAPVLVAVGVSTGGPEALGDLLAPLGGLVLPPIVVVQHIPTNFLGELVARLHRKSGYPCAIAVDGQPLTAGTCWFAPGDCHLRIVNVGGRLLARTSMEPPRRGHRPAAEVLFESCVELGVPGVGVLMTGMGQDGAQALLALRQLGWSTLGQDEATCAVYGMPRAAKALGATERELPLTELGPWLAMLCRARAGKPG